MLACHVADLEPQGGFSPQISLDECAQYSGRAYLALNSGVITIKGGKIILTISSDCIATCRRRDMISFQMKRNRAMVLN